ncbi:Protein K03A11.4 [Aphelenchoides avenae]|nr:Protein K03A11.4 [Aphelenchus avenae]
MGLGRRRVIGCYPAAFFSRRVFARRRRRFCCVVVASFIAFAVFLFVTEKWDAMITSSDGISSLVHVHTPSIAKPAEGCKLPKLDPLDASILEYLDPTYRPMASCNVTFGPKTRIRNRRVELIPELSNGTIGCEFRCHYPKDDYHARLGRWLDISKRPDCDVVEVRCRDDSNVFYEYVHTQIFVPRRAVEAKPASHAGGRSFSRPADVHLLILDAVSSTQFIRSMPKSLRFLEEEMGAINFRHVSKVADNSRPNAYALFFGKQPLTDEEWEYCRKPLDDEPFVGFEFKRRGYKTMMAEDWALGAFTWSNCKGFNRTPVDHYMHPLQLLYDRTRADRGPTTEQKKWRDKLIKEQCRGIHLYLLDYLKDFIDAYPDEPKFSITWMTDLAHDNVNGLYQMDETFLRFLEQYKEKLNNAFFYVMGDHGSRLDAIRATKLGKIEVNNPAMVLAVPERLRKHRKLMANVEANSRHLMTHHDTHATLINIAREGAGITANSPFDHLDTSAWDIALLGESYLYPFNLTVPRTCQNQRVPLEYCICQNRMQNVTSEKQPLAKRMARFVVGTINDFLRNNSALDVCRTLSRDPWSTATLLHLMDKEVYRITLKTRPNHGLYETHVKVMNESIKGEALSIVARKVARLDAYDAQSKCISAYDVRPFCYCRNYTSGGK